MGRILGIDHGDSRIGLSLSDPLHMIASPFRTISARAGGAVMHLLQEIITENDVEKIVLGYPRGMKNQITARTRIVEQFAVDLKVLGLPIIFEDERLSSVSAVKALIQQNVKTGHKKGLVDQTAAAIILQQFLDRPLRPDAE